jgi:hypothetical protein
MGTTSSRGSCRQDTAMFHFILFFETGSCYVVQLALNLLGSTGGDVFKLTMCPRLALNSQSSYLSQPPGCCDDRSLASILNSFYFFNIGSCNFILHWTLQITQTVLDMEMC